MIWVAISYRRTKEYKTLNYIAISAFPIYFLLSTIHNEVSKIYNALALVEDFATSSATYSSNNMLEELGYSSEHLGYKLTICFIFFAISAWAKSKHVGSPEPHSPK